MLRNYLKISFRNLFKRKGSGLVNIFGLAIGLSACLIIWKYVEFETSYEKFHINADRIYRVVSSLYTDGAKEQYGGYDLGPALASSMPEIKSYARTHGNNSIVIYQSNGVNQKRFREEHMIITDPTFLKIFSFKIILGNSVSPLNSPNSVIVTSSIAKKYFGNEDPIGKKLTFTEGNIPGDYIVSAVIEDVPSNSHFAFGFIFPIHNLLQTDFFRNNHQRWDNFFTYVELHGHSDVKSLENKIPAFIKEYRGNDIAINSKAALQFQPLLDIHYSPDLNHEGGHLNTIYFFILIASFILIIAWINYVNLSTAKAVERAREVGVKKALGVLRKQLISQFIFESALVNLFSVVLALALTALLIPVLNKIIQGKLSLNLSQPKLWVVAFVLFIGGTFAAGAYPAFILSSFKTTEVIKGKIISQRGNFSLRNGLVIFQFTSSLLLLVGTFVIYRQVKFMQAKGTGLKTDQMLIVNGPDLSNKKGLDKRIVAFKNELLRYSFVSNVSASFSVPGAGAYWSMRMRRAGGAPENSQVGELTFVDIDFIKTYAIPLVAGKAWTPGSATEAQAVIINEEAVRGFKLGTNEQALRERLIIGNDTLAVLGVVKNHHWNSLKKPFTPFVMGLEDIPSNIISIRLNGNVHKAIMQIEKNYKADFPDDQFTYYFLDDFYNQQYQSEVQFGKLFSLFSILAASIACLGLWGLASFTTIHRLKEISIRKVLGASAASISYLLSKQFLKPLLIGCLIAIPITWYGANQWLSNFPYRISYGLELFVLPILTLLTIALLTVSIQTIRASLTNPVNNLRSE